MQNKIKLTLPFATLIPDFIYQFLSSEGVDKNAIDCMELEDVRDALMRSHEPELAEIREFLQIEESLKEENAGEADEAQRTPADDIEELENIMDNVDESLAEVDEDLYHRYTPGELKYIFEQIIYNIDIIYDHYKRYAGLNLALSIGFMVEEMGEPLESNMIIEFLHLNEQPEKMDDGVFVLPMKSYNVSDDIVARVYFYIDESRKEMYEKAFAKIAATLSYSGNDSHEGHDHEH